MADHRTSSKLLRALGAAACLISFAIGHVHDKATANALVTSDEYSFTPINEMSEARSDFTATTSGDRIYLIGGCLDTGCSSVSDSILAYNPRSDSYEDTGVTLETARYEHSVADFEGRLYIFGGRDSSGIVGTIEVLDTTGEEPEVTELDPSTYQVLTSDGAAFALGNFVFYCGGFTADSLPSADCIVLDPFNGDTLPESPPQLETARGQFQVAVIDELAYAFGGFGVDANGSRAALASIEEMADAISLSQMAWELRETDEVEGLARASKSVVGFQDAIYVFGGSTLAQADQSVSVVVNDVFRYDLDAQDHEGEFGVWQEISEMPARTVRMAGECFSVSS